MKANMTTRTVIPEDFRVHGKITSRTLQLPPNSLGNEEFSASSLLDATKRVHRHEVDFRQATIADVTAAVHHFRAAGKVIAIEATCGTAPAGNREVSIDLQLGNAATAFASVLVAPIIFDADHNDCEVCRAPIAEFACALGDTLQVVIDVSGSSGTEPAELVVTITWEESP